MAGNSRDRDIVLGRNLAGIQVLNSPEYVAGTEAAAVVKRATAARSQAPATNRRRFRRALLALLVVMALVGVSAWLHGSH